MRIHAELTLLCTDIAVILDDEFLHFCFISTEQGKQKSIFKVGDQVYLYILFFFLLHYKYETGSPRIQEKQLIAVYTKGSGSDILIVSLNVFQVRFSGFKKNHCLS